MTKHWGHAKDLLDVLVWRSFDYDDNGMELYFTNPDTELDVRESRAQTIEEFKKKMEKADPKKERREVKTNILPELMRIINPYYSAMVSKNPPKKKTIFVLTDGVWSGMNFEYTVDVAIKSMFHMLRDLHKDLPLLDSSHPPERSNELSQIRPITIQFIQFGNDVKGGERLRRLDDDLKNDGYP